MSNMIITKEEERRQKFRDHMKGQKCPFRLRTETGVSGIQFQYLMPCDPDCVALIHKSDLSAFSCLRLMNVNYQLKYENGIEIFSGVEEE